MKPKNFPGRKLARQIAANQRKYFTGATTTASNMHRVGPEDLAGPMVDARAIRTKKREG